MPLPADSKLAHGRRSTYNAGCRCEYCKAAEWDYRHLGSKAQKLAREVELLKLRAENAELRLIMSQAGILAPAGEPVTAP